MLTINIDVSDGLVNGVFGNVEGFDGNDITSIKTIYVKFDDCRVGKKAGRNISFENCVPISRRAINFSSMKSKVRSSSFQFPLTLAWASTIHKVQGKTLDKIVVCLDKKTCKSPGQAYVALSRVKSLQGLNLIKFDNACIVASNEVRSEMVRIPHLI